MAKKPAKTKGLSTPAMHMARRFGADYATALTGEPGVPLTAEADDIVNLHAHGVAYYFRRYNGSAQEGLSALRSATRQRIAAKENVAQVVKAVHELIDKALHALGPDQSDFDAAETVVSNFLSDSEDTTVFEVRAAAVDVRYYLEPLLALFRNADLAINSHPLLQPPLVLMPTAEFRRPRGSRIRFMQCAECGGMNNHDPGCKAGRALSTQDADVRRQAAAGLSAIFRLWGRWAFLHQGTATAFANADAVFRNGILRSLTYDPAIEDERPFMEVGRPEGAMDSDDSERSQKTAAKMQEQLRERNRIVLRTFKVAPLPAARKAKGREMFAKSAGPKAPRPRAKKRANETQSARDGLTPDAAKKRIARARKKR